MPKSILRFSFCRDRLDRLDTYRGELELGNFSNRISEGILKTLAAATTNSNGTKTFPNAIAPYARPMK
ncbi:MAG: hypothetical protein OXI66_07540, partial [Boseongicola sp.]|nr:hypothetical protein [Boseongicola sp.]